LLANILSWYHGLGTVRRTERVSRVGNMRRAGSKCEVNAKGGTMRALSGAPPPV
jgi:hypothetical protein